MVRPCSACALWGVCSQLEICACGAEGHQSRPPADTAAARRRSPTIHSAAAPPQASSAAPAPAAAAAPSQDAELAKVDAALQALSAKKAAWAAAPVAERIATLQEIRARLLDQVRGRSAAHSLLGCP